MYYRVTMQRLAGIYWVTFWGYSGKHRTAYCGDSLHDALIAVDAVQSIYMG